MKGTIRMKVTSKGDEERIRTAVNLKEVYVLGKVRLFKSFLKALEISAPEANLFICLLQAEVKERKGGLP